MVAGAEQNTINKAEAARDRLHRRESKAEEVDHRIRGRKVDLKHMNSKFDAVVAELAGMAQEKEHLLEARAQERAQMEAERQQMRDKIDSQRSTWLAEKVPWDVVGEARWACRGCARAPSEMIWVQG